jgi:hypothetical protein
MNAVNIQVDCFVLYCHVLGIRHARQVTSRLIEYSEFIEHSLVHSHNLQSQLLPSVVSRLLIL